MQLYLNFTGKNIVLPIAHQYQLQSFIYSLLSSDCDLSSAIHDRGKCLGKKHFKLFTFGKLQGRYEIHDKTILYPDGFILEIRSPIPDFINTILQAAKTTNYYSLCGCDIELLDYHTESRSITKNEIKIKTLSPIVAHTTISDKTVHYFSPSELEFYQAIAVNAINKYAASTDMLPDFNFYILPNCTFSEKNKTVTNYKGTYITAWNGIFTLKSNPKLLNFLYNSGLGTKNAQGFGMFEIFDSK